MREPNADEQREGRQRRRNVILLARREAKEDENHRSPHEKEEHSGLGDIATIADFAQAETYLAQRLRQKRGPRKQPYQQETPEEKQRNLAIIHRIALS